MEPVGIIIMAIILAAFGIRIGKAIIYIILDRKALQARVNILEAKCGEKITDFSDLPPPPPVVEHNYYVPPPKPKPLIEPDVLMFMIKSCHPDKFMSDEEKAKIAKRATDWLLEQKNKQKRQGF